MRHASRLTTSATTPGTSPRSTAAASRFEIAPASGAEPFCAPDGLDEAGAPGSNARFVEKKGSIFFSTRSAT